MRVLGAKDSREKVVLTHAVRTKGVIEDRHIVDALVEDIQWLGYSHVIPQIGQ